MLSPSDRIAHLETELAELRDLVAPAPPKAPRRRRLALKFTVLGLTLALLLPAGAVLASHTFNDVPTSHQFHGSISAIAEAGITTGCGGGNYCPNGLVTRGQMAAFLSRLGALAPGSAPKVNADRVDGRHANQLVRAAGQQIGDSTTIATSGETQYGDDLTINAPTAGFVILTANLTFRSDDCTGECWVASRLVHVGGSESTYSMATVQASDSFNDTAPQWTVAVPSGANTFRLMASRDNGGGTVVGWWGSMTALFVPFGSTGGATLGLTDAVPDVAADASR